jgi:hypothetical protein
MFAEALQIEQGVAPRLNWSLIIEGGGNKMHYDASLKKKLGLKAA